MKGNEASTKIKIAGTSIDLTKSYDDNWIELKAQIESLYTRKGIYKNIIRRL